MDQVTPSPRWDWVTLRAKIKEHGLRNSLMVAPMPTASTSQIMGFTEAFEPCTNNIYTRRTSAGDFVVVNQYLVKMLTEIGVWNRQFLERLIAHGGSVQDMVEVPEEIKALFKTAFEIKTKCLLDMAADRGAFIDQSQSLNLFVDYPTKKMLYTIHMYGFKKGLKTGMYYLRSKAKAKAQQVTVDPSLEQEVTDLRKSKEQRTSMKRKLISDVESSLLTEIEPVMKINHDHTTSINPPIKKFMKNGKMYECHDEVCTSCSS